MREKFNPFTLIQNLTFQAKTNGKIGFGVSTPANFISGDVEKLKSDTLFSKNSRKIFFFFGIFTPEVTHYKSTEEWQEVGDRVL
jgi:hypothetical protein